MSDKEFIFRLKAIRRATVALKRDTDKHRTEQRMVESLQIAYEHLIEVIDKYTKEWEHDLD